jgi:hypothetical protein
MLSAELATIFKHHSTNCCNCLGYYRYGGARGGVVVEALRYKPEGRGFDSQWCHWIFLLTSSFWSHYGPGVDSAFNRNEYQEYFLGVKAASARADNLATFMCQLS